MVAVLVGELVDLRAQLVEVAVEREVGLHDVLALAAQRGDVLGQVGDHPLDPLQLSDAPPVLRNQPAGSWSAMIESIHSSDSVMLKKMGPRLRGTSLMAGKGDYTTLFPHFESF